MATRAIRHHGVGATMLTRIRLVALCPLAGVALLLGCTRPMQPPSMQFYPAPRPYAVFSPAVRVGKLLFLSGQIGVDSAGRLVPGGIRPEARQALDNIRGVLERYGSGLDRVAKCTVFLADIKDYTAFNEIYVSYFRERKPARSAMAASGLAFNARVEIECIGVID